jgi:hypothetical protein
MDTKQYVVEVWKNEGRRVTLGPDVNEVIDAYTPVEAVNMIIEAKKVTGNFYVEVHLKGNEIGKWVFMDDSPELHT